MQLRRWYGVYARRCGKLRLHKERLDPAEIVDAALDMGRGALTRGERRLAVSIPPKPLPVEGDRVRLAQAVADLLSNATKFADTGGRIEVRVVPGQDGAEIRVQDDGRGISRKRLDEIWSMFAQDEPGSGEGLGAGLSIVWRLVAMHGGAVSDDSKGPGCGAVFTVSLRLCRDAPAHQPMPRADGGPFPPEPPGRSGVHAATRR